MERTKNAASIKRRPLWKPLFIYCSVGLLVLSVNLSKFAGQAINQSFESPTWRSILYSPISYVKSAVEFGIEAVSLGVSIEPAPLGFTFESARYTSFQDLMTINFVVLWSFLVVLLLFTLRHRNSRLLVCGTCGLLAGYFALHIVSYAALVIVTIIGAIITAVTWVNSTIGTVATFVFVQGWWLMLLVVAAVSLYAYRQHLRKIVVGSLVTAGAAYFLYIAFPPAWQWFMGFINPALVFTKVIWTTQIFPILSLAISVLFSAMVLFLFILGALGVLATLGHLLIDQCRATLRAGAGEKHLLLGAFAIGSAFSLVMLTSVAAPQVASALNTGWKESLRIIDSITNTDIASQSLMGVSPVAIYVETMLGPVKSFIFTYMTDTPAHIGDALVLFLIMLFATLSLLVRTVTAMADVSAKLTDYFIPKEFLRLLFGLIAPVVIIFVGATSDD